MHTRNADVGRIPHVPRNRKGNNSATAALRGVQRVRENSTLKALYCIESIASKKTNGYAMYTWRTMQPWQDPSTRVGEFNGSEKSGDARRAL